jgi:hypothetical protein
MIQSELLRPTGRDQPTFPLLDYSRYTQPQDLDLLALEHLINSCLVGTIYSSLIRTGSTNLPTTHLNNLVPWDRI